MRATQNTRMVQLVTEENRPALEGRSTVRSSRGTPANSANEVDSKADSGNASVNQVYLHDHRMKDELEVYRERIANSER